MSLQPTIPPTPVYLELRPSIRACNESISSHSSQKGKDAGTQEIASDPKDPETVLSSASEDEFPDGGLKAWAVVLSVGLPFARRILLMFTVGCVLRSHDFRLCECVGCTKKQLAVPG